MTNTQTSSDPFEGARSFTLLARGKTSAPQSAAYGRMPMATCCRKRRLFCRRLLRFAPLRMTSEVILFNNLTARAKITLFASAPSSEQSAAFSHCRKAAMLACALRSSSSQKSHSVAIFGSPVAAYLRLNPKRVNSPPSNNFLQKQKPRFLLLHFALCGKREGKG